MVKELIALRESNKSEDQNKYIDSGSVIIGLEKIGLLAQGSYRADMTKIIENQENDFKIRKKAFLMICLGEKGIPKTIFGFFDQQQKLQILSEMAQWSNSSDPNKKGFLAATEKNIADISGFDWPAMIRIGFKPDPFFKSLVDNRNFTAALELAQAHQIDINMLGQYGRPPLHVALEYGNAANGGDKFIEFLIKQPDLKVNLRDGLGKTSLSYAVEKGYIELTKSLLEKLPVSPDEKIKIINALYDSAFRQNGCTSGICTYLKSQMVTFTPEVAKASFVAAIDTRQFGTALDLIQAHSIDVNTTGQYGRPTLHVVIEYGDAANGGEKLLAHILRQSDLNVNLRDGLGKTALTYSVEKQNVELTNTLLKKLTVDQNEKTRILNSLYDLSFRNSGCASGICTFLKSQLTSLD